MATIGALIALSAVVLSYHLTDVRASNILPSYDAYYWLELAKSTLDTGDVPLSVPHAVSAVPVNYQTTYPLAAAILSSLGGANASVGFEVLNVLVILFLTSATFALARRLGAGSGAAVLAAVLLFTSPYMLYRQIFPLPETLNLSFLALVLWSTLLPMGMRGRGFVFSELILAGALLNHQRSTLLIGALFAAWLGAWIVGNWRRHRSWRRVLQQREARQIATGAVLPIIALIANFPSILRTLRVYAGQPEFAGYTWEQLEPVTSRYVIPRFVDYRTELGTPLLALGLLGFALALLDRRNWRKWILPTSFGIIAFGLTQSLRVGFYAPPDRFYTYLVLALAILSANAIGRVWKSIPYGQWGRLFAAPALALMLVIPAATALSTRTIFYGFTPHDFEAAQRIEADALNQSVIVSYATFGIHLGIDHSEADYVAIHRVFSAHNTTELNATVKTLYPASFSQAQILVTDKVYAAMKAKYPSFERVIRHYPALYEEGRTFVRTVPIPHDLSEPER